jgi:chaperonin GroES
MNYESADSATPDEAVSPDTEEHPDAEMQNQNLAEDLDEDTLTELSQQVKSGYEIDKMSCEEWMDNVDEWVRLAKQVREEKSYPWAGASNVKYPLLATAAMQFGARAYPSLVPSNGKIVKGVVVGKDPVGSKLAQAERVSSYMSYQIFHEMSGWEEDMDKMLMMLPIVGTMFKKTFFDKSEDQIKSCLILPKNLIVNYWTKKIDDAERISEIIYMSKRVLEERIRLGIYRDVDLGDPPTPTDVDNPPPQSANDASTPYTIIEQHTFWDKDGDGYPEPYIVTFEETSGKILRLAARYDLDDVVLAKDGKTVAKIKPLQMYTKFGFVPNPDGGFYDIGFGVLLGPLNESVNTLINIQIDAGHMDTLQSGFIGKGLRLKAGDNKFQPGEWKMVAGSGDDLRKQIVQLPTKEPSDVLFQLMGALITSGKELASVAEIFVGKMPGQNTPATTTMASIEQGMKVFTAVYKRLFRALAEEFNKIFRLNFLYTDPQHYVKVIDQEIDPEDFNSDSCDIVPGADPTAVSQTEKLLKAQGLLELLPLIPGLLDPIEVISRVLEAQEQPNWQKVFAPAVQQSGQLPPPQPDPKLMAIQAKVEADQRKAQVDIQKKQMEMELAKREGVMKIQMEQQKHAQDMQQMQESTMNKAASEIAMSNVYAATERQKGAADAQHGEQAHQQKMKQGEESHKQKMQQTKESQKLSPKTNSKSGNKTK